MSLRDLYAQKHPLLDVLRDHNVQLIGEGDQRKAKCPFHKDKTPSFSVNVKAQSWNCFAGCGSGGVVELIAKFSGKSPDTILEEFRKSITPDKSNGQPAKSVDWNACVAAFTPDHIAKLATWRGYRPEFVALLVQNKAIGIADGNLAFPIFTAGRVTGTHQRIKGGTWLTTGGTDKPWIIGNDHFESVIIFESQWDALAFMDKTLWLESNLSSVSSIVITRGANKAKFVKNMFPLKGDLIAWMQNDPEDDEGNSPAKSWLTELIKTIGSVRVCWPPKPNKDLNDWCKSNATATDITAAMESAPKYRDPSLPPIKPPLDVRKMLRFDPLNDDASLLGHRYLCRGGSAIWVGTSGIGKSVLNLQAAITFALNLPLFGLEPKRPLRSVILSAEDDEGDISETVQGVLKSLKISESDPRFDTIMSSVFIYHEAELRGLRLVAYAEELVRENKADFLWLNPLLSYYSGNPNDSQQTGEFCGTLSALQFNTGVCSMLIHHTGKPKEADSTKHWSLDDFSYIGLGSSVWTNWARAIIVLQQLKNPPDTFVLRFAKRGNRTGIVDDNYCRIREVYLEYAPVGLSWVLSSFVPEILNNGGRPSKCSWNLIDSYWDGSDKTTLDFIAMCRGVLSVSDKTVKRVMSNWMGVHIVKNTNDLWIKANPNGQNWTKPF